MIIVGVFLIQKQVVLTLVSKSNNIRPLSVSILSHRFHRGTSCPLAKCIVWCPCACWTITSCHQSLNIWLECHRVQNGGRDLILTAMSTIWIYLALFKSTFLHMKMDLTVQNKECKRILLLSAFFCSISAFLLSLSDEFFYYLFIFTETPKTEADSAGEIQKNPSGLTTWVSPQKCITSQSKSPVIYKHQPR